MASVEYKQLNEEDLREPVNMMHVKQHQNKEEIKQFNKEQETVSNKFPFWFHNIIYLESIKIDQQQFRIKCVFNIYWVDNTLINQLNEDIKQDDDSNDDNDIISILYKDLPDSIKNMFPVDASNASKLFENSKSIIFVKEPVFKYSNKQNNVFNIALNIDSTFYEHYDVTHFPFDGHLLNIKLNFNVNKFYFTYHYDQYKTEILFSLKRLDSAEWITSSKIPPLTYFDNKDTFKFGVISLRMQRDNKHFIYSVLLPLFIVISCSFSIYSINYLNFSLRMEFVFLFFVIISLFNMVSSQMNIPKSYSKLSYINMYLITAYLILALMTAESIIIGKSIKIKSNVLNVIEIIFVCCLVILWLIVTHIYFNVERGGEKYWHHKARKQFMEWKKV